MIEFEDVHRLNIIQHYIKETNCRSYLEIGCDKNQVFKHINVANKIGVDPRRGGTHRMTSDKFFENNNQTFDVIFIDGLHYYDQVAKDVINGLTVLNPNGIILIHDMLPRSEEEAIVPIPENPKGFWLGDVWKLAFDLNDNNDLNFNIYKTDCGVGLLSKKASYNKSSYNYKKLKSKDLDWNFYVNNWSTLPLISAKTISQDFQ